jgi:alkylhydroperoxidase family enzyme
MPRIRWIDEDEASGELAQLYDGVRRSNPVGVVPDILKTMSLRPDFLRAINDAAALHFGDGALTRAQHELIASYVSAINRCHY